MSMFENFKNQIEKSKNKRKFTIPKRLYEDPKYCKERLNIILMIAGIFEKNKDFKNKIKKIQDKIIIDIEESCYNATIKKATEEMIYINWENYKFSYSYQLCHNKITKNLDIDSEVNSSYLINAIVNDIINISDLSNIAEWTSDKLCPEKSNIIKQNLLLRNSQKLNYKTSSLYTCKNCKKRSVAIKEYQGRSLDEGTNLSLTCLFCNYNWVN
jgi:DNA-directed RNA polymerase subunit M/transcription elongation factor TFIIS